ncbi:MAG: TRAP transporter small permease [Bacteroidia bacterium]|nr:TRAP transporter small permease [Bacteroidia bacterium]
MIARINQAVEWLLITVFGIMVLTVTWQVVSRFVLGDASSFSEELARFCLIWLTVLGAAYIVGQKGHIAVDYLYQKSSPQRQLVLMKLVYVCIALFALVVMIIGGGQLVYITLHLGQTSSALQLPLGYVYSIVPISGLLMLFYTAHNWSKEGKA